MNKTIATLSYLIGSFSTFFIIKEPYEIFIMTFFFTITLIIFDWVQNKIILKEGGKE